MRFNPKARLDRGRVSDSGGRGGRGGGMSGGGMRLPIPGGAKAGGGIGGLVIVILIIVLSQCLGGGTGGTSGSPFPDESLDTSRVDGGDANRYANCQTGEDANQDEDCARVAVENSLYDFWNDNLENQAGVTFRPEGQMATFTGAVQTGCGQATAQVGPFYCPADEGIYLDTTFFEDVLQGQLGGPAGDFVEPYVLAHEYGHHIQNLTGDMGRVRTQQGPESDAVRLELQADCYAGMWARAATSTDDAAGVPLIIDISDQDMAEAVAAAKSVGDDRIQQQTSGRVDPEGWTHGSAEQRQRWFMTGYDEGSMSACDTFSASSL
jgi:uncharacterized protein